MDHTYSGCTEHTTSRVFYALTAAEGMLMYRVDVTNVFSDALPHREGLHVLPDKAFQDWWVNSNHRKQIPANHVVPVLTAIQAHREAPQLLMGETYGCDYHTTKTTTNYA